MTPELGQGLKAYRKVQVESMTPGELVIATYDVAIQACEQRNMRRAGEAIYELMNSLDFTYEEMAGKLVTVYDWIYRQVREGKFDEAREFLLALRESWAATVEKEEAARVGIDRPSADATG